MSDRTPQVGDLATIDGEQLTITAVDADRKLKVKLGCSKTAEKAGMAREVRSRFEARQAELDSRIRPIQAAHDSGALDRSQLKQQMRPLLAQQDDLNAEISKSLTAAEAQTLQTKQVGVALRDLYWVESESCWSVPGRFNPAVFSGNRWRRDPDPADLRQAAIAKASALRAMGGIA